MSACPACQSARSRPVWERGRAPASAGSLSIGSSRAEAAAVALEACLGCGHVRQSAPAPLDELASLYEKMQDPLYQQEEAGRRRAFEVAMQRLRRLLPPPGRLLDVGCATGLFLEVARERGWDVEGVEPSAWACAEARRRVGDRITQGFFEELARPAASFDVVTMWDVLEHVPEPGRALDKAAEVLRAEGVLTLNVPAADSWIARAMGPRWPLILPEHLHYFTRRSITLLLNARGFDVIDFLAHPVFFGLEYVFLRLAQHGLAPEALSRALGAVGLSSATVPLLMGEVTVVARRRG